MQIDAPLTRRRPLSMTPLIDVIFLLLLFFMLSSTFSRFTEVEVSGGGAAGSSSRPDVILMVDGADLRLNGDTIETGEIRDRLAALSEAGAKTAVIAISDETSSQAFLEVLHQASQSSLSVSLARSGQ